MILENKQKLGEVYLKIAYDLTLKMCLKIASAQKEKCLAQNTYCEQIKMDILAAFDLIYLCFPAIAFDSETKEFMNQREATVKVLSGPQKMGSKPPGEETKKDNDKRGYSCCVIV